MGINHIKYVIRDNLQKYPGSKLVIMNLGGKNDPTAEKDFDDYDMFIKAKELYPDAEVYFGNSISPELKELYYKDKDTKESDIDLAKALDIISKSHYVITGRYHGLIFSKALNVECYSAVFNYKINAENAGNNKIDISITGQQLGIMTNLLNNYLSLKNPYEWSEDDRNTNIVKLSEKSKVEIPFIQAMDNVTIYKIFIFN